MAHAGNLTVVGDPDQSIYSWRNANADGFDNLLEEYPEASVVRLTKNYRSTNGVLQLAAASLQKEGVSSSKRNGGGGGGGGGRTRGGGGGGEGGAETGLSFTPMPKPLQLLAAELNRLDQKK